MPASVEAAVEARAAGFAGLTGLIGTTPCRFYPVEAAQGSTMPYVTYQVISGPRHHVMGADKDSQPRVQMDAWGANWASCRAVRDQLLAAFDRWSGVFGGTTVQASICENDGSQIQPDDASRIPRLTCEFIITLAIP